MPLKINAKIFRSFIEKTTANGLVKDCRLVFGADGLSMVHRDVAGVILIVGSLAKSAFTEYQPCEITVKDTTRFIKALKVCGENVINIVVDGVMVKLLDESGSFDFVSAEKVECHLASIPQLEYQNTFLVKKSIVDGIIERAGIVSSEEVTIFNKDKVLAFLIGKETDKANTKMPSMMVEEISSTFDMAYFKALAAQFDPVFDLSIGVDGFPSRFIEKTDKYNIQYYLTPQSQVETK